MRKPDHMMKTKRTKSVLLTEKAFLILKEIRKKSNKFNLSEYLSHNLIKDYGDIVADETYWKTKLIEAQQKRDELIEEQEEIIEQIARKMRKAKEKVTP